MTFDLWLQGCSTSYVWH